MAATKMKITAVIYAETSKDPEDVCLSLDGGLESAIAHFPDAEIVGVEIEQWVSPSSDELTTWFEEG